MLHIHFVVWIIPYNFKSSTNQDLPSVHVHFNMFNVHHRKCHGPLSKLRLTRTSSQFPPIPQRHHRTLVGSGTVWPRWAPAKTTMAQIFASPICQSPTINKTTGCYVGDFFNCDNSRHMLRQFIFNVGPWNSNQQSMK